MPERRNNPIQIVLALAGVALAVAGVVRFAQGRTERVKKVAATTTAATDAADATKAAPAPDATGAPTDQTGAADSTGAGAAETGATAPASGAVAVDIANFAFDPDPVTVPVGATITWTNRDSFAHTATGDDATLFDSMSLKAGASFSHTFATAGTFTYKCAIHNSMTGTVVVQ